MKPKNQKQFNWSYVRFYLMWMLTTLLALIPLVILFNKTPDDEIKRQSGANVAKDVEKVNYDEISAGLNQLTGLVGAINKGNIQQNIDDLEDFADSIKINSNKQLGKQLEDLSEKMILICEKYKGEVNDNKDKIRDLKAEISTCENDKQKLDIKLTSCVQSLSN